MFRKYKNRMQRLLAGAFCIALLLSNIFSVSGETVGENDTIAVPSVSSWQELLTMKYTEDSYVRRILSLTDVQKSSITLTVEGATFLSESQHIETKFSKDGKPLAYFGADSRAVYRLDIPEEGLYRLAVTYEYLELAEKENSNLTVEIDGKLPFRETENLSLPRIWKQETLVHREDGNDIHPDSVQVQEKAIFLPADESGMYGYYYYHFSAGEHTLMLSSPQGGFGVHTIDVGGAASTEEQAPAYGFTDEVIQLEGEEFILKNDNRITSGTDRSDAHTSPSDPVFKKINVLSGSQFMKPQQTVTWAFTVKEEGCYRLNVRYIQQSLPGMFVSRNVYVDGKPVAFENTAVKFPYSDTWQLATARDAAGEELLLDLAVGEHTLTLEVTLGSLQSYVKRMDDVIFALNYLYRKIIMVTGTTPDVYRDYHLEDEIPYLIPYFEQLEAELRAISNGLKALGAESGMLSVLDQTVQQLKEFTEDSYRLQDRLSHYVSNISSISSLVMEIQEGPLGIDCLYLESTQKSSVQWKASFWESLVFHVKAFVGSFFCDYSAFGNTDDQVADSQVVTAWFGGSREQSELLQDIIKDSFSVEHPEISVNLRLVALPLTQAILAGTAPDVCLTVARNQPVNLGCRGVLEDLTTYEGYQELETVFGKNFMVPYSQKGAVYGVPVTLDYHMMFYRKDILDELGVKVPETWEDFYSLIPIMQRNNMFIGLPYTMIGATEGSLGVKDIFATLLLQNDAELYTEDLSAVRLDDQTVTDVFHQWTDLYSKYQFDLEYNLYNRFRTGEMPLAISSYATYGLFVGAAPEIKGLWGMAEIPGTRREDGTINRAQAASGTAAVLLKGSKQKAAAWEFLKWWVSAETQGTYGNAVELLMGETARYMPAHPEAVKLLPWSEEDLQVLMAQRKMIQEMPEVLGGYYVVRSIDNAFRTVLYNGANYKEALLTQQVIINTELKRKQQEFK